MNEATLYGILSTVGSGLAYLMWIGAKKAFIFLSTKGSKLLKTIEKNSETNAELKESVDLLLKQMNGVHTDLDRAYNIFKVLAGEKWPEVRKEAIEEMQLRGPRRE